MDLGIANRVALVIGGSSGMGHAVAAKLAREGARVALTSRSEQRAGAAAKQIGALSVVCDTLDKDALMAAVDAVESTLGQVEILVTNSGGPPAGSDPLAFDDQQWLDAYNSLVRSPIRLIERVLPAMREASFGRVVNISSSTVREPAPNLMLSNVHRAAALAAFKTLAREHADSGVTFNTVLPGRIATGRLGELYGSLETAEEQAATQIPAGRLGTVDEYAAMVVFLCSAGAGYVTGTAVLVDGGLTQSI